MGALKPQMNRHSFAQAVAGEFARTIQDIVLHRCHGFSYSFVYNSRHLFTSVIIFETIDGESTHTFEFRLDLAVDHGILAKMLEHARKCGEKGAMLWVGRRFH